MKGSVTTVVLAMMATALLLMSSSTAAEAALTCDQVITSLSHCMSYLVAGGSPPAACCGGVKDLANLTPTTADRQAACNCIKAAAARVPNINQNAATSLPEKCGVTLNIPISKNINCNDVQ